MSINKFWNALIVVGLIFLMSGFSSATWAPQDPGRSPTSEEQRRQMLDRLSRQVQESRGNMAQATNPASPSAQAAKPPSIPPAVNTAQREGPRVQINYENADLYDFINEISNMIGLTPLVVDSEVKGSVNIISTSAIYKEDVLPLFNLILKNNNAALVKQGDVYQIVPISSALKRGVEVIELPTTQEDRSDVGKPKVSPPPVQRSTAAPSQGRDTAAVPRLATHVIRVEFVPVKDLIEPAKLFMTEGGVIMPYERLNMLIVTDYTDSAARVMEIIRMLDNNFLDPDLIDLIKIKNNASADVVEDLKKIFGSGAKDSATGISFVSLDRMNAIFVIASSKRGLEEMRRWIGELDAESSRNIQTFIYMVENSTASQIAAMLSALYGGDETSTSSSSEASEAGGTGLGGSRSTQSGSIGSSGTSRSSMGQSRSSSSLANQSYNQGNQSYYGQPGGGYMGGTPFGSTQRLGPQLNTSRTITSQILRGGEFSGLRDTVRLVVNDNNNSLVIQATPVDYAYILEAIKKMDVLPRQARIDVQIYEVELTNNLNFGVSAFLQKRGDVSKGETLTTGSLEGGTLSANTFAFVGNSRQILLQMEALRQKAKVKILESPSILALDGTQASFNVGTEYPVSTGSYITGVGGSASNIQYRETGVTLMVLPRISASGTVTMDITQEVSSKGAAVSVGANENALSFPKALVENSFYVKDGETVAIAGLIRDSEDSSRNGVPFLSEIPVLGSLFGSTTRNAHRTELIILITPHVIRTHEKLQEMTEDLKDSLRNVRKMVDEKEKERIEAIQDAQEDRDKIIQDAQEEKDRQDAQLLKEEEKEKKRNKKKSQSE